MKLLIVQTDSGRMFVYLDTPEERSRLQIDMTEAKEEIYEVTQVDSGFEVEVETTVRSFNGPFGLASEDVDLTDEFDTVHSRREAKRAAKRAA